MAEAPLLPAEPWYRSEVQVRAVIAMVAQIASIAMRLVGKYVELPISTDDIDALAADALQVVAIIFGGLAVMKRQTSTLQPLTLTKAGAEKKADTSQLDPVTLRPKDESAASASAAADAKAQ